MHINKVGLAMRLCWDYTLIRTISRRPMCAEETILLVDLAHASRAQRDVLSQLHVICLNPKLRRPEDLLAVRGNAIAQNSVCNAEFSSHLRVGTHDHNSLFRWLACQPRNTHGNREEERSCCSGFRDQGIGSIAHWILARKVSRNPPQASLPIAPPASEPIL